MLTSLTAKSAAVWVCVLYTVLTVTSSSWQLLRGIEDDSNLHLLARFAVTVVGVGCLALFVQLRRNFRRAPTTKAAAVTYVIAMAMVLVLTWGFGRLQPLHPDAYRDIVINFTVVWVGVALVAIVAAPASSRLRTRRARAPDRPPNRRLHPE